MLMTKLILTILTFSLIHAIFMGVWIYFYEKGQRRVSGDYMNGIFVLDVANTGLCLAAVILFAFKTTFFGVKLDYPALLFILSLVLVAIGKWLVFVVMPHTPIFYQGISLVLFLLLAGVGFFFKNSLAGTYLEYPAWTAWLSIALVALSTLTLVDHFKNSAQSPS